MVSEVVLSLFSEDPSICSISNPNFVIYSSVVSFYLPFLVTLLLYVRIYIVLRQRQRKRVLTRQGSQRAKACYKQQVWPSANLPKQDFSNSTELCPSNLHWLDFLALYQLLAVRAHLGNPSAAHFQQSQILTPCCSTFTQINSNQYSFSFLAPLLPSPPSVTLWVLWIQLSCIQLIAVTARP